MASDRTYHSRSTRYGEMEVPQTVRTQTRAQPAQSTAASSTSKIPTYSSTTFSRHGDKTSITSTQPERRRDVASIIPPSSGSRKLQKPLMYGHDRREGSRAPVERTSSIGTASSSTRSLGLGIRTTPKSSMAPSTTPSQQFLEKPRRHVLRRKASSINQHSEYARTESTASSYDLIQPPSQTVPASILGGYRDPYPGSILGITLPSVSASTTYIPSARPAVSSRMVSGSGGSEVRTARSLYPLFTQNLPVSTPLAVGCPSSPSTRCSESPGPFSRTSTPTSMSSHSPALRLVPKAAPRPRQSSPTRSRPPVTLAGRRAGVLMHGEETGKSDGQGLPALRESLTSSSSGSTVKAGDRGASASANHKTKTPRLSPPPPSPPIRRSSKKFSKTSSVPRRTPQTIEAKPNPTTPAGATQTPSAPPRDRTRASQPTHGFPPTRPSRVGTSNLEDQYQPSPVIHSNLSHLETTGHKRRESVDLPKSSTTGRMVAGSLSQSSLPRSMIPGKQTSPTRQQSFAEVSPSPRLFDHGRSPPAQLAGSSAGVRRGVSPTSAGSGRSPSRFGLFSRRPKATSSDEAEAMAKKGPTAGTGHEGYGKYARRGRSGSASTSGSRGRSTSASSTSGSAARTASSRISSVTSRGEPDIDDFFLERLAPVVIGGGGMVIENRNRAVDIAGTGIGQVAGRPSLESRSSNKSKTSLGTRIGGGNSNTSVSSLGSTSRLGSTEPALTADGDNHVSDASDSTRVSALAARRSLHRSQTLHEKEPIKVPAPIKTNVLAPSPSLNSYDTSYSSMPQTDSTIPLMHDLGEGREGLWLKPKLAKPEKSSRRWNFFQRSQRSPPKVTRPEAESQSNTVMELPATITPRLDARPVAHYAILDAPEQLDSDVLEDSSHEAENSPVAEIKNSEDTPRTYPDEIGVEEHFISPLLPVRPVFAPDHMENRRPSSPKVMLHSKSTSTPEQTRVDPPQVPRPSRLPQVGRIPRVISKRDHSHKPPVQSFSRPFAQQSRPSLQSPLAIDEPVEYAPSDQPPLRVQTDLIPSRQWQRFEIDNLASAPSTSVVAKDPFDKDATEFIAFPPRKMSEVSGSSSSGILSFANTTAVLPRPDAALSEDEVWNEYDDLLDNVMSTTAAKTPRSATSSLGAPFQYSDLATKAHQLEVENRTESLVNQGAAGQFERPSLHMAPEARAAGSELTGSGHGSRLVSPLPSSALPSTPMSFTEFFAGYEERNIGSDNADTKASSPSRSRSSSNSAQSKGLSLPVPSGGDKSYYRNTQLMSFAEKERDGPEAQTNLRFGALMTSRWLSFGRVLFSPAHTEIKNNRQDRILILDGLGNDDWSFYCALTYPDATVYNLSPYQPSGQTTLKRRDSGAWQPPSNHRQIHHTSIMHPFPFPKGFFTAVVLRFPAANSEAAYRNAISECKRVLRPGGYLEISVLELDMMNMGNRARRAVRMLKVRMQVADDTVSLKPVSDNIQRMLGRRGFENLNRCMVGVPVAGKVSDSRSGSFDETNLSLGDMIKDQSEHGDEGITKMVAKVGRWWYTRCYELGVLPDGDLDRSIWNDPALLKECDKRETSFKLLICYAQKPLAPRRRTVSV